MFISLSILIVSTAENCAEAGLDAGCCTERSCSVTYGTNHSETCYCDDRCKLSGDCCEDVDQTRECKPSCTLTIISKFCLSTGKSRPEAVTASYKIVLSEKTACRSNEINAD